jgi:hypothetical protein
VEAASLTGSFPSSEQDKRLEKPVSRRLFFFFLAKEQPNQQTSKAAECRGNELLF